MKAKHVAFFLDDAYGHIYPTLGIARELMNRGHKVSYAVSEAFAPAIKRVGAEVKIFLPLDCRPTLYRLSQLPDGSYDVSENNAAVMQAWADVRAKRTRNSIPQLEISYANDRPDAIIHDDAFDYSGRELADLWKIPRIRHWPAVITPRYMSYFIRDELVLVSVPAFFNGFTDRLDTRFHFLGFVPERRHLDEWTNPWHPERIVLACPTTSLFSQESFCRLAIAAFGPTNLKVILSASAKLTPISDIDERQLTPLPVNFRFTDGSPHLSILRSACLSVGQGGQRSSLEALYSGVPCVLVPPSECHDDVAMRVSELGLGTRVPYAEASAQRVREAAVSLLSDASVRARVGEAQRLMHEERGEILAADLVENRLRRRSA